MDQSALADKFGIVCETSNPKIVFERIMALQEKHI